MSSAPQRTDKVLSALHRTFINTSYDYACDGYCISSDETKEYHVVLILTLTKGEQPYKVSGSCNCRDWRLGDHRDDYMCIHQESLMLKWGIERRKTA